MLSLPQGRCGAIGLDLGGAGLRAVQLCRQGSGLEVYAAAAWKRRDGAAWWGEPEAERGQVVNEGESLPALPVGQDAAAEQEQQAAGAGGDGADGWLAEALRRLDRHGGFRGREVVLHCPAARLDLRPVQVPSARPRLPRETVLGMLKLQLAGHLSFPVEEAVFDYYPLDYDEQEKRLAVMAVTADGRWVKQRLGLVTAAGFECVGIDALPCVLARVVSMEDDREAGERRETRFGLGQNEEAAEEKDREAAARSGGLFAVLDIGLAGSTLVAGKEGRPVFCRYFDFGGRRLTRILRERLGLEPADAERLKVASGLEFARPVVAAVGTAPSQGQSEAREVGIAGGGPPNGEQVREMGGEAELGRTVYAALRDELGDFVEGLTRALNYVISESGRGGLARLLLCGGGSRMRNLAEFLTRQFELPVEAVEHPLLEAIEAGVPPTRAGGAAWATALGLALPREVV